ncbi:uncharacterized protein LOC116775744 isoform X2 [Danaus plexippus]|uniref:uncharacterized protein LOC116775744 isoform X2 n=1 Tax=Danaus plexippus TaxID=13037 RepID=UPI002AAFE105|nr:uncharacterized protein LOC116775744 isoform X2 [Danaus plexippus]
MHFVILLNIFFSFLFSSCLTRTLVRPIGNISSILKANNTLTYSHQVTPNYNDNFTNDNKNEPKPGDIYKKDIERLPEKIKELSKERNPRSTSDQLLDKILDMILKHKDLELKKCNRDDNNDPNDLRISNLHNILKNMGLGQDYYDSVEYVETKRLPISLETPQNGVLGRLYFDFDPIKDSGRQDYSQRAREKTLKNGVLGKIHFNFQSIDDSEDRR